MEKFRYLILEEADKFRNKTSCKNMHIAVLFTSKNKILSIGVNNHNCTYKSPLHDLLTIHAEMDAIYSYLRGVTNKKLKQFKRKHAKIAVFRVTPNGEMSFSRPCRDCLFKLSECGIRKIYWTVDNETVEEGKPEEILKLSGVEKSLGNKNYYKFKK